MANDEEKTIAIISYITWIGWIIALIMNNEKKHKFARFHIRQTLLIWIIALIIWVGFIIPFLGFVLFVGLFILWIIGLIGAINGEEKEIPFVGGLAQEWFKGL